MIAMTSREQSRPAQLFIHYLNELPLASWIDAARRRPFVPGIAPAEAALTTIVRAFPDREVVFGVKQSVLEALQRFECPEGRRLTRSRFVVDHLRRTTENAVLAVLLKQFLSPDQFAALYVPFESVIPLALLIGLE